MPDRDVFSEQEVTEIIRRAIAIQDDQNTPPAYVPGVTREELERIAAEVGVTPDALARAVSERGAPSDGWMRFVASYERVIDGELDPNDFDILASQIRPLQGRGPNSGVGLAQVGRSLTGNAWTGAGSAAVNVSARGGRTKIEVKSSPLFPILMTAYPALIGGVITASALAAQNVGAAIAAGVVFATAGIFGGLKAISFNQAKSKALADRLADTVRGHFTEIRSSDLRENLEKPQVAAPTSPTEKFVKHSQE